jgi:hypothetical protein
MKGSSIEKPACIGAPAGASMWTSRLLPGSVVCSAAERESHRRFPTYTNEMVH